MLRLSCTPLQIPESYDHLQLRHISVSNIPRSSPNVTPVLQITLNRPDKHNAFTDIMRDDLERVYELFNIDSRVKALVLTGAGKNFCSGADLEIGFPGVKDDNGLVRRPKMERNIDHRDGGGRASLAIHYCSKPTIAAIQGSAVGVGITITLPACIRVAYAKAKVGFVFSRRGVVMEGCSSYFLPRLVGHARAIQLAITGTVHTADHKLFEPLFAELCATPEATLGRAIELATSIAQDTSTVSTKLMRELIYRSPPTVEEAHLLESQMIYSLYGLKDNLEGVRSFLERRQVKFKGEMPKDAPDAYPWWKQIDVGGKSLEYNHDKSKL